MFRAVGDAGFYAVGLSTRTLLHRKQPSGQPLTVAELAEDYQAILDRASIALNLPPTHGVVLTGWSRGASLAVLVGGGRHAPPNLAGVIAIGLEADENLAVSSETDDDPDDKPLVRDASSLDMYALICAGRPGQVRRHPGDRRSLSAGRPCAGVVRSRYGASTILRGAREEPSLRWRSGRVRCGAARRPGLDYRQVTADWGHHLFRYSRISSFQYGQSWPPRGTPVVHVVPDPFPREDFRERVGEVALLPRARAGHQPDLAGRELLVCPRIAAGWPGSRPDCGSRSCRRTCRP